MPNMSHCRFENTLSDLRDCYEHMYDELGDSERKAKERLLLLCSRIASDFEDEIEDLNAARRAKRS